MKSELVPIDGRSPIPILKDVTVIGRREFCDVQVDDASLSKRHAVIVRTDGLLIVRDLASTNGTKVNGQRVMWAALMPNDRLTLGRHKFKVYLGPDNAPSPSERYRGEGADPRPSIVARPVTSPPRAQPQPEFAPPTPFGVPTFPAPEPSPGSTDPDADPVDLAEFLVLDEDETFLVELD